MRTVAVRRRRAGAAAVLFGCDRKRPFARVDHLGLLWLLKGGTIVELHGDRAIVQTAGGVRQVYRRRPVEVGIGRARWLVWARPSGGAHG